MIGELRASESVTDLMATVTVLRRVTVQEWAH